MNDKLIELCQKLNQIPHLNLTEYLPPVPYKAMIKELLQFNDEDFYPYITGNTNKDLAKHMAENWKGFCIIDSCKEGRHNIDYLTTENNFNKLTWNLDENGKFFYDITDVGQLMPETTRYLYKIIDKPQKTRISRIMPRGGNATWHSHYRLAQTGDKKFEMNEDTRLKYGIVEPVLHIPLITNQNVFFGVAENNPGIDGNYRIATWQKYDIGEVWLFNSYFYHNVYNKGSIPRDHVMMYMKFDDEKMLPILEQAVENYKGPLLDIKKLA